MKSQLVRALFGVVALTTTAHAQPLFTLVVSGSDRISPGGLVTVEAFIENMTGVNLLSTYQATVEITPAPGTVGTLTLADPVTPDPNNTSIFVDRARPDWVFAGVTGTILSPADPSQVRLGALLLDPSDSVQFAAPRYAGTFVFLASGNAEGNFNVNFRLTVPGTDPPTAATFIQNQDRITIPVNTQGTLVNVSLVPDNDDCADALPLTDGVTGFSTENTTTDGSSHPGSGCDVNGTSQVSNDVWFDHVASCTGILTVSTCGTANFDTRVAVYEGCGCPATTLLQCNDNAAGCAGQTSEVVLNATAGTCYKVRVGGTLGASGTGSLTVACVPNDTCSTSIPLTVPATVQGTTLNAGVDTGLPTCGPVNTSPGVWYSVTGTGGLMTASLCGGASFDSRLTVFQGSSCGALTCVGNANNTCGNQEALSWCSTSGTTYRILVHGNSGAEGPFTLNVSSQSCNDNNACTGVGPGNTDQCISGACVNTPNYDTTTLCCRPSDRNLTPINDGNPCTTGNCNTSTGTVTQNPVPNGPNAACEDGQACTTDECLSGNCANRDINTLPCSSNADCPGEGTFCDIGGTNLCVCVPAPTITLESTPGSLPVDGCYAVGEVFTVFVEMGFAPVPIIGAQFFLEYDVNTLELANPGNPVRPGAEVDVNSPFETEINESVNVVLGHIDYVVGDFSGVGTTSPATLAAINFRVIDECEPFVRFRPSGPNGAPNRLTTNDPFDPEVIPDQLVDLPSLSSNGSPPVLSACPADIDVDPDPGEFTATVSWTMPTASDTCDGPAVVECSPASGSSFSTGTTTVTCSATNTCGAAQQCLFDVNVTRPTLTADVQLSPTMATGPIDRCIRFELFDCDAPGGPVQATVDEVLTFSAGQASGAVIDIPGGNWQCITARDPKHTLRSTAPDLFTANGFDFSASFVGNRSLGGHWLVGGNVNGDAFIDILDFGIFVTQFLQPANPNTPCGMAGPDANINGDNVVDIVDFVFVQVNSLMANEPNCCGGGVAEASEGPVTAISVRELRRRGLTYLRFADLNRDGWLDEQDIIAFLEGATPVLHDKGTKRRSGSLRE